MDNSLKLGFTNIRDFRTNFFDCESLVDKEGLLFAQHRHLFALHLQNTVRILTYVFEQVYFTQYLTSFSSIDHILRLYRQVLLLFHLTQIWFSRSTHLLICLFLEYSSTIVFFLQCEVLIMLLSQFLLTSHQIHVLCDHSRDVP